MCVHCHCDIQSVTCNIMLQQIISQHSQRQTSNPRSHKHTSNGHYQAGNYSEGTIQIIITDKLHFVTISKSEMGLFHRKVLV